MRFSYLLPTALLISPLCAQTHLSPAPVKQKEVTQLCFGSCHRSGRNVQIWDQISKLRPQLFLFMGDNIYGDTLDTEKLKAEYAKLNAIPSYQALKRHTPVLATWDDHDYGLNDMGNEHPKREGSKVALLNAFSVPKDAMVRERDGLYQSHTFGPKGKCLQIILLDTRWFRTPLSKKGNAYVPIEGDKVALLGEVQWKWLHQELKKPADARLIISSIQVLNEGHRFEKWANMPKERQRLLKLLKSTKTIGRTVILSGDRHFAEVSCLKSNENSSLWEVTSSGMTHAGGGGGDKNPLRVGKRFGSRNFGSLKIEWKSKPTFFFTIHDNDGAPVIEQRIELGIQARESAQ